MATYYCSDFSFDEIIQESQMQLETIPIQPESEQELQSNLQQKQWDKFFETHHEGNFFKARNYIYYEFKTYFDDIIEKSKNTRIIVCETGCGHGCTLFPLLFSSPLQSISLGNILYLASDYSQEALQIMSKHSQFNSEIIQPIHWDLTETPPEQQLHSCSIMLSIFCLSALHFKYHVQALMNINHSLQTGGLFLFRDYGIHDMTMKRHKHRFGEYLFARADGTLCYYFSLEYMEQLARETGFEVLEMSYACINNINRKTGKCLKRVFIHAVLKKL